MQENEERLRLTLTRADIGTWDWDLQAGTNIWSEQLFYILGHPAMAGGGTVPIAWWRERIHPDDRDCVLQALEDAHTRGTVFGPPHRYVRPDGRIVWLEVHGHFIYNEQGNAIRMLGVTQDMARKAAEEAQARLIAELQRINAEFQQFSYIVSHDLGEPLRTMRSYVQLLARELKDTVSGDAQEYMTFVSDAAQRMQQMLSDLLAYTRAGQPPEFHAVDCGAVLMQVLTALQSRITECGAIITHDPLPTVHGDATRLGQVLQNLIGNALKFCAPPPRVHLSATYTTGCWTFTVRDNGIGIDLQQSGRLFQVFQRLHTYSEYTGTGIGLAICKRIVEQHGGRIWVESQPYERSTFYFTIPKQGNSERGTGCG